MTAVSFQSVSKSYRSPKGEFQALKSVSLDIEEGEFFGLLGPNGAGKTTMISILAGLARASSGRVLVQGSDVQANYADARRKLGIVPQELVFDPFFTVREALQFQSGYFGVKNNDDWIDELLDSLGLIDKAHNNMRQLSGGMKRRVLVAQALVHKPPVIVLDEPTAGVDVDLCQTLWKCISRLNREGGHTVVLTTHYLEEAQAMCQRVAMLKTGKVVALDTMSALIRRIAGSQLQVHLKHGVLPADLRHLVLHPEEPQAPNKFSLRVNEYSEVEKILARLREAGAEIDEMQLQQADLEDIFLQIMDKGTV